MYKIKTVVFLIFIVSGAGLSLVKQTGAKFEVDKTSPSGEYRVKMALVEEKATGTREYTERLRVRYFRKQEVILDYEAENSDQYEPSLREGIQAVEWIADNVLRSGQDPSGQPFEDELIVSNDTDECLKNVGISYGRYQSFRVFDLNPKSRITLRASPEFKPDRTSNYFLGYGGESQGGKKFEGTLEGKERKSPADGPLKFEIKIRNKDLR